MEWVGKVTETPVIVPEGTYNAVLSSIWPEKSEERQLVRIGFRIEEGSYEGNEVSGLCSDIINEVSKLGRWIKAIKGSVPEVGEDVLATSLIGNECRIVVTHTKKDNGTTFANVQNVLPVHHEERK